MSGPQVMSIGGRGKPGFLTSCVCCSPGGGLIIIDSMPDIRKRKPIPLVSDLVSPWPSPPPAEKDCHSSAQPIQLPMAGLGLGAGKVFSGTNVI